MVDVAVPPTVTVASKVEYWLAYGLVALPQMVPPFSVMEPKWLWELPAVETSATVPPLTVMGM